MCLYAFLSGFMPVVNAFIYEVIGLRKILPQSPNGFILILALMLCVFPALSAGEEEAPLYWENEWNFVEQSMDISLGIPEDTLGRLPEGFRRTAIPPILFFITC